MYSSEGRVQEEAGRALFGDGTWNWSTVDDKTMSSMEIVNKLRAGGKTRGTPGQPAKLKPRPAHLKKTLVLDVDETLVRLTFECVPGVDTYMMATSSQDGSWAYVYFRPYVHQFLAIAASLFEVVAFTAGNQEYADQVLDALDPNWNFFSARLYRENCFKFEGEQEPPVLYVKDLSVLDRDLADVILVDNSIISMAFQIDNGLLVCDFDPAKKPDDKELAHIVPILHRICDLPDVRPVFRKGYRFEEMLDALEQGERAYNMSHMVSPVSDLSAGLPTQGQQHHASMGFLRASSSVYLREVRHGTRCRAGPPLGILPPQASYPIPIK